MLTHPHTQKKGVDEECSSRTDLSREQFIMMVSSQPASRPRLSFGSGAKSSAQSFVLSGEILFHADSLQVGRHSLQFDQLLIFYSIDNMPDSYIGVQAILIFLKSHIKINPLV